jgi:chromosome segregation ATPase
MNIRKPLAGMALVATLTVGGYAGIANAQTTTPTNPTQQTPTSCDKAHDHIAHLHSRIDTLKDHIAKAEARIDALRAAGHNERADKLAKHIEALKDRLAKLETRLAAVETRVDQHCPATTPTTPPQP